MRRISYFNSEGYSDPTAYQALKNIIKKEGVEHDHISRKLKKRKVMEKHRDDVGRFSEKG
jgi:hypothetical protein